MSEITVYLPDGSAKNMASGSTGYDIAKSIGKRLAQDAIAVAYDGTLDDLHNPAKDGATVEIITWQSDEALNILRHSAAHIMAAAILDLYPGAQFGIGPAIEDGFYYDINTETNLSSDDLDKIAKRMQELIDEDLPFKNKVVTREEAKEIFADQPYKLELIDDLDPDETIKVYKVGDFVDLCRGPHLPASGCVKAFKLTRLAGAYWRGDSDNDMLTRIYGTAFWGQKALDKYLYQIEEAEKRDHRKLGKQLDIFMTNEKAGVGLQIFKPNGARVVRALEEWLRKELIRRDYEEIITPHIYKSDLWKTSGHYDFYHDDMYFFETNEEEGSHAEYGVKPMNCPGHVLAYADDVHSYRDLPVRFFEFGTVYRHELSGVVHGLFRARGFTQDDAHLFCREDQVVEETVKILDLVDYIMNTFDLTYSAEISTRPEDSIGTDEMWDKAVSMLEEALEIRGLEYDINEGDGAFYGPKIDIQINDSLGRTWQCSTIQVDFNLPERFELTYRTADNDQARPWMLHRAIFGSIERFLGILIEHYAGAFPLWLAPKQVEIITIADRHIEYAEEVAKKIKALGGRVGISAKNEPMRIKIAKAQDEKVPYMLVVGDKEQEEGTVSVRDRTEGDLGAKPLDEFLKIIEEAHI